MTETEPTGTSRKGADPRAPHWFDFNKLNELPNDWTFTVLEWDDDPDADDVKDRGEAEVIRGKHRVLVTTWLQPKEPTFSTSSRLTTLFSAER